MGKRIEFGDYKKYHQCAECERLDEFDFGITCCPACGAQDFIIVVGRIEYEATVYPYLGKVQRQVKFHPRKSR